MISFSSINGSPYDKGNADPIAGSVSLHSLIHNESTNKKNPPQAGWGDIRGTCCPLMALESLMLSSEE